MFSVSHLVENDARSGGVGARIVIVGFGDDRLVVRDLVTNPGDNGMRVHNTMAVFEYAST